MKRPYVRTTGQIVRSYYRDLPLSPHHPQVDTRVMMTSVALAAIAVISGIAAVSYPGLYVVHSDGINASTGIWKVYE